MSESSQPEPQAEAEQLFPEFDALPEELRIEANNIGRQMLEGWTISPRKGATEANDGTKYLRLVDPEWKSQKRITNQALFEALQLVQQRVKVDKKGVGDKSKPLKEVRGAASAKINEGTGFTDRFDPNVPLVAHLIEENKFLQKSFFQFGKDTFFIVMQTAKIDPQEIMQKLQDFENADKLIQFVRDRLVALLQASKTAGYIQEQEDEIKMLSGRLAITVGMAEDQVRMRSTTEKRLQLAMSCLDREGMNRFMNGVLFGDVAMQALSMRPEGNGKKSEPPTVVNNYGEFS